MFDESPVPGEFLVHVGGVSNVFDVDTEENILDRTIRERFFRHLLLTANLDNKLYFRYR